MKTIEQLASILKLANIRDNFKVLLVKQWIIMQVMKIS